MGEIERSDSRGLRVCAVCDACVIDKCPLVVYTPNQAVGSTLIKESIRGLPNIFFKTGGHAGPHFIFIGIYN